MVVAAFVGPVLLSETVNGKIVCKNFVVGDVVPDGGFNFNRFKMDRDDWMYKQSPVSAKYILGVQSFLKAAEAHRVRVNAEDQLIFCPCASCKNFQKHDIKEIKFHLLRDGFVPGYTCWSKHGESLSNRGTSSFNEDNDQTYNNEQDTDQENDALNEDNDNFNEMYDDLETNVGDNGQEKLRKLLEDELKPLYVGCNKYSKLRAVLRLSILKSTHGWSDKSFTDLLVLLNDMLPEGNELPLSSYQAKKMMCPMGLEVERIHACPNDCMLYRNEFKNHHKCLKCNASRYKRKSETDEVDDDVTKNGPPAKSLGPKQPGNDIDVYLAPLIDDLKTLWSPGVNVYDSYKKEYFDLHAMIFCTISDFPAYGNLSGYSTKGKLACPVCEDDRSSMWLSNCKKKTVYMGHRRFLPINHIYWNKALEFDGKPEHGKVRKQFDAFSKVRNLNVELGKNLVWSQAFGKKVYLLGFALLEAFTS
ncbi:uncharacterized protein LOC118488249 [Helianthus annuus]|uniref:uncharacterized protein LOC118488249 n=1 Tax=Helianthus annuus TaxID=4232 RepID=UPI0016531D55|nr:uncharacterized protein LOC118488249 [Helianthus annuus]